MAVSQKGSRLIRRYKSAVEDLAFRGASHPDDWEAIDHNYDIANKALRKYIMELEGKVHVGMER